MPSIKKMKAKFNQPWGFRIGCVYSCLISINITAIIIFFGLNQ